MRHWPGAQRWGSTSYFGLVAWRQVREARKLGEEQALPPGKKIRVLFDSFSDRLDAGLPLTYDVTLCYRGPTGRKPWKEPYRLDLGMYLGSEPVKGIPDLVAELGNIRKEIEKWKGSGIVVHAIGQQRQDRIKTRRMNAHILRQQGRRALARTL